MTALLCLLTFHVATAGAQEPVASAEPAPAQTEQAVRAALRDLDARERVLRAALDEHPFVAPSILVGVGVPAAAMLLTTGPLLLADSTDTTDNSGYKHERKVGAGLLVAGVAAAAGAIWGAVAIHQRRRRVRLSEYELSAIAVQRSILQRGVLVDTSAAREPARGELPSPRRHMPMWTSRGRVLLSGGIAGSYSHGGDIGGNRWSLGINPSFAYFVRDRLGIGFYLAIGRSSSVFAPGESRKDFNVGGGGQLIRELPLGERTSLWFWPYLGVYWQRSSFSRSNCSYYDCPSERIRLLLQVGAMLPVMVRLTDSWGFGFGPFVQYAWGSGGARDVVSVGASTQLIGTF